jgi:hypothetical protein
VWVAAPFVGALWTPPYWGYGDGDYLWHAGYWGPYVGFYGGINYGFGYTGRGFYGGYWQGSSFNYNRSVMNVNANMGNVYDRHVDSFTSNRVSYNGGQGGLNVRPIASEEVAARQRRMQALPVQVQQQRAASTNRAQFASENHGRPAIAAVRPNAAPAERTSREAPSVGREAPGMAREAQPMSSRPEERAPMQTNNARPGPGSMNARSSPMEGRQEQAPRTSAPESRQAPRQAHQGEAQREAPQRQMEARPAPEARPAQRPQPMARPEAPRSAPEARQQAPHSAPEVRQQAPHQAPEARPSAPQGGHPPEAHPAPQKKEK